MKQFPGFSHGINLGGWLSQCDHTKGAHDIPEEQRPDLRRLYREVRVLLDEGDLQAQ